MNPSKLCIRVDASSEIGMGHLVRTSALYEELSQYFDCLFLLKNYDGKAEEYLEQNVLPYSLLEDGSFVFSKEKSRDIILLDVYNVSANELELFRNHFKAIISIHDYDLDDEYSDIIINQSPGSSEYYSHSVAQKLLGLRYAILRKPFLDRAKFKKEIRISQISKVMVAMGGTDPLQLTHKVVDAFNYINRDIELHVVSPETNPNWCDDPSVSFYSQLTANEIIDLMSKCHLGIFPASGISIEAMAAQLPVAVCFFVANHSTNYHYFVNKGMAIPLGDWSLVDRASLIKVLANALDEEEAMKVRRKSSIDIDGMSVMRVTKAIRDLDYRMELKAHPMAISNCDMVYEWANHPETRSQSINEDSIPYESHVQWFNNKILSTQDYFYLITYKEEPVAQIRFDWDRIAKHFILSYSIDPMERGKGLGSAVLLKGIERLKSDIKHTPKIYAVVKPENRASSVLFERLGFQKKPEVTISNLSFLVYEKN